MNPIQKTSRSIAILNMAPAPEHLVKRIRVLLADDDLLMLAAINELLAPDFEIVAMVSDGYTLVETAFKLKPDVIVSDISMPKMSGFEAARRTRASLPGIKFIFLTMHGADGYRMEAQSVGAVGYVLKSAAREELAKTVRDAYVPT